MATFWPAISIGVALACADLGRPAVTVLGDGDFMMGGNAIWTAVKHQIPLMFVINNNQSYFNDELHQENIARKRDRRVENRWIGQAMDGPAIDIAKFAESQGAVGIGPVKTLEELEAALKKGVEALAPDGLVEAFSVIDAPGFNLCVQWHPEWGTENDPDSQTYFHLLGKALRGEL